MKNQTRTITNWKELVDFTENINPFTHTFYMSGFVNKINKNGTVKIQKLIFTTTPIKFFCDKNNTRIKQ